MQEVGEGAGMLLRVLIDLQPFLKLEYDEVVVVVEVVEEEDLIFQNLLK